MPALPSVASVVRCDIVQLFGEDINIVNRIFVKYSGDPPNAGQLNDFANSVGNAWHTRIMPFQSNLMTLHEVKATDLSSDTAPVGSHPFAVTGTHTDPFISAGAAAVISHHIERRYRGGHPRSYICGMVQSQLLDGQSWDSELITDLTSSWAAFQTDVIGAGWLLAGTLTLVNVSYFQGFTNHTFPSGRVRPIPNLRPGGPITDTIDSSTVNPHVGSQRRRNKQGV